VGTEGRRSLRGQQLKADGAEAHNAAAPYNALSADAVQHNIIESVAVQLGVPTTEDVGGVKLRRTADDLQRDIAWFVTVHDNATFTMRPRACQSVLGNFWYESTIFFGLTKLPSSGCDLKGKPKALWSSRPQNTTPIFHHAVNCAACVRKMVDKGHSALVRSLREEFEEAGRKKNAIDTSRGTQTTLDACLAVLATQRSATSAAGAVPPAKRQR